MIKRSIGIDIGTSYLNAVQLVHKDQRFCVEKIFNTKIRRSSDSISVVIKRLFTQYGFDRRAKIGTTLPHGTVFFRNLETDVPDTEQISSFNVSDMEHGFPIETDEIVVQICSHYKLSDEKNSVLAAATTKTNIKETLNHFNDSEINPALVDAAIYGLFTTAWINHPEITAGNTIITYIDGSYLSLAIIHNNNVLITRSIPVIPGPQSNADILSPQIAEILSREIDITWRKVLGNDIELSCRIYIAAVGVISNDFKTIIEDKLNCQVTAVDPYAKVKPLPDNDDKSPAYVAEGIALKLLTPEKTLGINFIESADSTVKKTKNMKKELKTCVILAVLIIVISLVGLLGRLLILETEYSRIKKEMKEIFQKTLPQETNIVNPLAQMKQKLELLQRDYSLFSPASQGKLSPVEVLYTVSESAPSNTTININSMLITSKTIRLTGLSQTFDSVYNWQQALEKIQGFSNVDAEDVTRDSKSQLVRFTMIISIDKQG